MKTLIGASVIALALGTAAVATPAAADHADVGVQFQIGNAAFGYSDGYWDRDHHWHHWRNERERHYFREHDRGHYYDRDHSHYRDEGWRHAYWNREGRDREGDREGGPD